VFLSQRSYTELNKSPWAFYVHRCGSFGARRNDLTSKQQRPICLFAETTPCLKSRLARVIVHVFWRFHFSFRRQQDLLTNDPTCCHNEVREEGQTPEWTPHTALTQALAMETGWASRHSEGTTKRVSLMAILIAGKGRVANESKKFRLRFETK